MEKEIDQVIKELNNETEPAEETFLILEEEVKFSPTFVIFIYVRFLISLPMYMI